MTLWKRSWTGPPPLAQTSALAISSTRGSVVGCFVFECGGAVRTTTVVKTVVKIDSRWLKPSGESANCLVKRVELRGFEPLTPTLPVWCATNCAIAPRRARRRYTKQHLRFKTARHGTSPPASGPSGRAGVCSVVILSRVSGARIQPTAATARMTPLMTNAVP
jgi:hypothetical protein